MGNLNRDHGGDIDAAIARYGGLSIDWIDLSTGINRVPYPIPPLPTDVWTGLPTKAVHARLLQVASAAYASNAPMLAVAGAQAAIQMIPRLGRPGRAKVLSPTYNEHAASFSAAGWSVEEVGHLEALQGADIAVLVNPNNPDGRISEPDALMRLAGKVGRLVVDESFVDPVPELSVAPLAGQAGLLVLRSFGKFYGLAGLRLGFVLGASGDIGALAEMSGPWPVAGPAIAIATSALADQDWARASAMRLQCEIGKIDALAVQAGWQVVGGCALFRLYETPDARAARDKLASSRIWTRIFPNSKHWVRLGLPGTPTEWNRLASALHS